MKAVKTRARLDPMLEALGGLAVAGVVAFAYLRISSGISTVGDFMGFVTALLMAAQPIRALGNLAGRVHEGLGGGRKRLRHHRREGARSSTSRAPSRLQSARAPFRSKRVGFAYDPGSQ